MTESIEVSQRESSIQERLVIIGRSVVNEEDDDGDPSNYEKWLFVMANLVEVSREGFFVDVDFMRAYEWEVNDRLLAYGYLAELRSKTFRRVLMESRTGSEEHRILDSLYHGAMAWYLKIKDKYESLSAGKTEWSHKWLN